jgi:hypothetical protein
MAVLQVYLDESGKQSDHPLVALCCVCAPPAKIDKFGNDWNVLLQRYAIAEFHMKRASRYSRAWGNVPKQTLDKRIEALKPFADCIGENLELGLIEAWDVKGFKAIPADARAKIGNVQDPYYLAFVRALLELVDYDYLVRDRDVGKIRWFKMFADEQNTKNCLRPTSQRNTRTTR